MFLIPLIKTTPTYEVLNFKIQCLEQEAKNCLNISGSFDLAFLPIYKQVHSDIQTTECR